jgi:hypothetical protein
MVQQHMHWTSTWLGQALSWVAFYYSLQLNVCEFNAAEIFLLETKEGGGGWQLLVPFLLFQYSLFHGPSAFVLCQS